MQSTSHNDDSNICYIEVNGVTAYRSRLQDLILRHGWALQGMEADGETPRYAYSIGLYTQNLPDLMIATNTMSITAMYALINKAAGHMVKHGAFAPHTEAEGLIPHKPVLFRELTTHAMRTYCSMLLPKRNPLQRFKRRMLQIFLPTVEGAFTYTADDPLRDQIHGLHMSYKT